MQDCARTLQYLRHKADEFGIDPTRVAVSGGSAGAVITMWIAYKGDMANPASDDPPSFIVYGGELGGRSL